jgi:hypothetical protein
VYYGERTGGLTANPTVAKANVKSKSKSTRKTSSILPTDPNLHAKAKTYWATVYGITGEKVATAFVGDDGDDKVIFARPITNSALALCSQDRQGPSADDIHSSAAAMAEGGDMGVDRGSPPH